MTVEKLKEDVTNWIEQHEGIAESLMYEGVRLEPAEYYDYKGKLVVLPVDDRVLASDFSIELVEQYGGEDMGSTYYTVYKFTRGDFSIHASFNGHHQSHYGTDYVDWCFVKPVEVTKIEWSAI